MFQEICKWVFLGLVVWIMLGILVAVLVGKGIKVADARDARPQTPPQDAYVRGGGRHPVVVVHVD